MFIEVFTDKDKDHLLAKGYKLLKTSQVGDCKKYTFANSNNLQFNSEEVKSVVTNTLTF